MERQDIDIRAFRKDENLASAAAIWMSMLSAACRRKSVRNLRQIKPETLGAAARIPGMTPAAYCPFAVR